MMAGAAYIRRQEPVRVLAKSESMHTVSGKMTVEYPCGDAAKVAGFTKYRDRLVEGTCGIPTATSFCGETKGFECMLNDFYSNDCAGISGAPADLCASCTDPHKMAHGLDRTFFPLKLENFFKSECEYFNTVAHTQILEQELYCAAMMMVSDGCASGTTLPTCFK